MTEATWRSLTRLEPVTLFAFRHTSWTPRHAGLFACGCCRLAQDWSLPDAEADAVEATERYLDREILQRTWRRRGHAFEAGGSRERSTQWERDFREAIVMLFYPAVERRVPFYLLSAVSAVSSTEYAEAFEAKVCGVLRDVFNPFRPVAFDPAWGTDTAVSLAKGMYESRDFSPMPILADALQDAGCDSADVLNHCRDEKQVHVRGCWVIDLVLGKA